MSILSNREQFVENKRIDGSCDHSVCLGSEIGVPQGACISCILFCLYIDDLPLCVKELFINYTFF